MKQFQATRLSNRRRGGQKRYRWSLLGLLALVSTLALSACSQTATPPVAPVAAQVDVQATVAAGVSATVEAMPTQTPEVRTEIVVSTPLPTPEPVIITEVVTVVVTAAPAPSTPVPTSTSVPTPEPTAIPESQIPAEIVGASASLRDDHPLIVNVDIELDKAGSVYVEYENPKTGKFRTATVQAEGTSVTVPIVRLRPETDYAYTTYVLDVGGNPVKGVSGSFMTGPLPEALARIQVTAKGKPTSGLLLMDTRDSESTYLTVMDDESNFVWFHRTENLREDTAISMNGIRQKPNYNFVFYAGRPSTPCCLREITPLGEMVDELVYSTVNGTPHHDFLILPDDQVLYLADVPAVIDDSANGGSAEQAIVGDSLRIWDQSSGTTREVWNTFDFWDPTDANEREQWSGDPIRWVHINSISLGPRGNYILSPRNRNQVISVSPDFQEIEWQLGLGNEDSPESDFRFEKPEDRFYRSHTASQLRNGNILVFDNGLGRPEEEGGEYSRALELTLEDYDLVVFKAWEYRSDPDIYSRNISGALRLDNGNTLVNFGQRPDKTIQPVVAVEVERDGTVVWEMEMLSETSAGRFRIYTLDSIMGETKIE